MKFSLCQSRYRARALVTMLPAMAVFLVNTTWGDDWTTYRGDAARSGVSAEQVDPSTLIESWVHVAPYPPRPAWPGPAKWDAYASLQGLKSMRNYDPVFHIISVGDRVYFASSTDDSVHCLDAETGNEIFTCTTGGPVRIAPTYSKNRLYFGSDDGYAYCISARSGEVIWRHAAAPSSRLFINNGRLISFWPVRTGIVVRDDTAYFGSSMFPWKSSYLSAVDARTGEITGTGRYRRNLGTGMTMEGAILASKESIIVPQGRIPPQFFNRQTGAALGALAGGGGCFVLLTEDDHVFHGPGNKAGWITDSTQVSRSKIASYDKGNALLVSGDRTYLLSDSSLAALNRTDGSVIWQESSNAPFTMIMVGGTIFTGGDGVVSASSCENGQPQWTASVHGRAYGLAFANGRLFASTDTGRIHSFRASGESRDLAGDEDSPAETSAEVPMPSVVPIEDVDTPGLVDRWVFQSDGIEGQDVRNQARQGGNARILGPARIDQAGAVEAIILDGRGGDAQAAENFTAITFPRRELTAECWLRVDVPLAWGGAVSMHQDNGEYERGWLLGYRNRNFAFCLTGTEGGSPETYVIGPAFTPGAWHHLVGTYDGERMVLYVDGQPAGESSAESGDILYPEHAFYQVGAYRDDDEYFRMTGMLHEVRVYDRALGAGEILSYYEARQDLFPDPVEIREAVPPQFQPGPGDAAGLALLSGPILDFPARGTARVRWRTEQAERGRVAYFLPGGQESESAESGATRDHEVLLRDLLPDRVYSYRVLADRDGEAVASATWECDTSFNYNLGDTPDDENPWPGEEGVALVAAEAARDMLALAGVDKGIGVLFGGGSGELAYQLALQSNLSVLVIEETERHAARLRRKLMPTGLYGARITALPVEDWDDLPLPPRFANLVSATDIVMDGRPPRHLAGMLYVLQPGGRLLLGQPASAGTEEKRGVLAARIDRAIRMGRYDITWQPAPGDGNWTEITGPPIPGSGTWTHMYGSADNSAFSGEDLSGARSIDDLEVQWAGRPGPRYQSDRGNRKPAPLAVSGRLYTQGLNRVVALDGYNGAVLWTLELPELQRFNIPRDCSNWCADDSYVFLALGNHALQIEGRTGEIFRRHQVLDHVPGSTDAAWGYIAREGDLLVGSSVQQGASYTDWWGGVNWYDQKSGSGAEKVCSDSLFALDLETGLARWTYESGLIVNPTITIGDGRIYFLEARHPDVLRGTTRRLAGETFWGDQYLVALDVHTGQKVWEREARPAAGTAAVYLVHAEGMLILQTSSAGEFALYTFDADDGSSTWRRTFAWEKDHHGGHLSRPAVVQGKIYSRPLTMNLSDGEVLATSFPGGHQCGSYACTSNAMFLRAGNLGIWDLESGSASRWERLRPDCWISTIPANGMLLSPEGGGGCSCGSWLETSIGFVPLVLEGR